VNHRFISRIICPSADEISRPMHSPFLIDAEKDNNNNLGKLIDIDPSLLMSKTDQCYAEPSDAYKKWTQALNVPDLDSTIIIPCYISPWKFHQSMTANVRDKYDDDDDDLSIVVV
jgi:hypothetical protein